jgi:hypothetical protein
MCSGNVYDKNNVSQALMACMGTGGNNQPLISVEKNIGDKNMEEEKTEEVQEEKKTKYAIRKLTPKECFRLMNFSDEDSSFPSPLTLMKSGRPASKLYCALIAA